MKCVGKLERGDGIDIFEKDIPQPGDNEVLFEVKTAALCGSDLSFYHWNDFAQRYTKSLPKVLGHEFSGVVIEIGKNVTTLEVGDRIAGDSHIACGDCYYCRTGLAHICENMELFGISTDGCFAEYATIPQQTAIKLPDGLGDEQGALLEPLGVAMRSAVHVGIGDSVALFGGGPIGIFAQMLVKLGGAASVYSVEVEDYRLDMMRDVGATEVIDVKETAPVERIMELTDGRGVDLAIELSGSRVAAEQALQVARKNGTVFFTGNTHDPINFHVWENMINKELVIRGSFGRILYNTWYRTIAVLLNELIPYEKVITHRFSLGDAPKAFELADKKLVGKALFIP